MDSQSAASGTIDHPMKSIVNNHEVLKNTKFAIGIDLRTFFLYFYRERRTGLSKFRILYNIVTTAVIFSPFKKSACFVEY